MATFRSKASASTSGGGSSLTISKPAGVVSTDQLVAVLASLGGTIYEFATPSGWTLLLSEENESTSSGCNVQVFTRQAGGLGASSTWSAPTGSTHFRGAIYAYSGADPVTLVGASAPNAASVTSCSAPSLVAPGPGRLLCAWGWRLREDGVITPPASVGNVESLSYPLTIGDEAIAASGATGVRTATCSSAEDAIGVSVFVPAPAVLTSSLKRWDGSAWVSLPVSRWDGADWANTDIKRWDGAAWNAI